MMCNGLVETFLVDQLALQIDAIERIIILYCYYKGFGSFFDFGSFGVHPSKAILGLWVTR